MLSREPGIIESAFELIGADGLRTISNSDTIQEDESLDELARVVDGSVVIVPDKSTVYDMIESLQSELPWLH